MKTLSDQLTCAKRELALRNRCYPKWLSEGRGKLDANGVRHEIECMEAIVATLEKMLLLDEVGQEFRFEFPDAK